MSDDSAYYDAYNRFVEDLEKLSDQALIMLGVSLLLRALREDESLGNPLAEALANILDRREPHW